MNEESNVTREPGRRAAPENLRRRRDRARVRHDLAVVQAEIRRLGAPRAAKGGEREAATRGARDPAGGPVGLPAV
jgi:hypothetical protein